MKSLSSVVSANRVNGNGWEGGECGNQYSFEERHSMIEEIKMDVIMRHRRTLTSAKWVEGKGKKVQYLIINRQSKTQHQEGESQSPVLRHSRYTKCRAGRHQDRVVE